MKKINPVVVEKEIFCSVLGSGLEMVKQFLHLLPPGVGQVGGFTSLSHLTSRGLEKTHICSIVRMGNTRMAPTSGQRDVPSSEL